MFMTPNAQRARIAAHARAGERGSTLVVTLVLLVVLALLASSSMERGGLEVEAAGSRKRYAAGVNCVEAARELVISQLIIAGASLQSFAVAPRMVGDLSLATGHYDTDHENQVVTDVVGSCSTVEANRGSDSGQVFGGAAGDLSMGRAVTNVSADSGMGLGGPGSGGNACGARIPVVCRDDSGRSLEFEFVVRLGM